uniref:Uncharacterized protein n=1 Tax=Setaria digitata TaxID=48799 RepID=A0A915PYZ5_9BILA
MEKFQEATWWIWRRCGGWEAEHCGQTQTQTHVHHIDAVSGEVV